MDDRSHEGAARLVLGARPSDGLHGLDHRHRLPGQDAFVALELVDLEQAQVGRHDGPDAQCHHVTRHEFRDRYPARPAIPPDLGLMSNLSPKGRHGQLRPVFVEETQADAESDDHGDDHGIGAASGESRHQRRREQKDQDRVPELTEEDRCRTNPMRTECVGPEPTQSVRCFARREPFRTASETRKNLVGRKPCGSGQVQVFFGRASRHDHNGSFATRRGRR